MAEDAVTDGGVDSHRTEGEGALEPQAEAAPMEVFATPDTLRGRLETLRGRAVDAGIAMRVLEIGRSRAGRPLWGVTLGGRVGALGMGQPGRLVTITAGAHADEPTGTLAALGLMERVISDRATNTGNLSGWRFAMVPMANPDGTAENAAWFPLMDAGTGADGDVPVDPRLYFANVRRDAPGDDVEFGYPLPGGPQDDAPVEADLPPPPPLRPECGAIAAFFAEQTATHGTPALHASLHAMAAAEGAWFLLGADTKRAAAGPLMTALAAHARDAGLPPHDSQRNGDKGFHRLGPGFATTPTGTAMRAHFRKAGDLATAAMFRASSMELAAALAAEAGGAPPLALVTEIPLFTLGGTGSRMALWGTAEAPPPSPTAYESFRAEVPAAAAALAEGDAGALEILISKYALRPVSIPVHVNCQVATVLLGLEACAAV